MLARVLAPFVLSLVVAAGNARAGEGDPVLEERLRAALAEIVKTSGVPGASLALVLPDDQVVSVCAGVSDRRDARPLEPADKMLGGSTGKTFFAALALALAHEEKLALDDPVALWLGEEPWYPRLPNAETVALRDLLLHVSGIPEYYSQAGFVEALVADRDRTWKPEELLEWVLGDAPLFAPGEGWSYADTNYVVLGLVLERAGEEDVYAAVSRRFLAPLELASTVPSTSRRIPGLVTGESNTWSAQGLSGPTIIDGQFVVQPQFEWTGGGFATTPTDLARWADALFEGRALEGDYLDAMLEAVPARTGPGERYGLGVQVFPTRFGPMHGHGGFFPGYLTCLGYLPEHHLALAVQVNSDDMRSLRRPLHLILEEMAGLVLEPAPAGGK